MASSSASKAFSVVVLASDLGIDARPFLSLPEAAKAEKENRNDCPSLLPSADYFSDLDVLQFFRLESGCDKSGYPIFRIVGKYFPAHVIPGERLKKYVFHKILIEMPDGPFCIVYIHSTVQKDDNSPGITILRWIYEELPDDCKDRLQVVYFIHPGLRSRLVFATLGRFLLSKGLYWKIKYISRLRYLWQDIKKEDIEIPEFVEEHDKILEHRPLTDYGIEPYPFHLTEVPSTSYSFGRYEP
ncbi:uncharacterized protein LOC142552062 [Primulina tabacum]|uniref:uncharacterized protein LOC142552062 n=1 Tax=Primulina tabacum TaxID=48773 RepID=UPI003F5A6CB6